MKRSRLHARAVPRLATPEQRTHRNFGVLAKYLSGKATYQALDALLRGSAGNFHLVTAERKLYSGVAEASNVFKRCGSSTQ
jgi:hypothetical protein